MNTGVNARMTIALIKLLPIPVKTRKTEPKNENSLSIEAPFSDISVMMSLIPEALMYSVIAAMMSVMICSNATLSIIVSKLDRIPFSCEMMNPMVKTMIPKIKMTLKKIARMIEKLLGSLNVRLIQTEKGPMIKLRKNAIRNGINTALIALNILTNA